METKNKTIFFQQKVHKGLNEMEIGERVRQVRLNFLMGLEESYWKENQGLCDIRKAIKNSFFFHVSVKEMQKYHTFSAGACLAVRLLSSSMAKGSLASLRRIKRFLHIYKELTWAVWRATVILHQNRWLFDDALPETMKCLE